MTVPAIAVPERKTTRHRIAKKTFFITPPFSDFYLRKNLHITSFKVGILIVKDTLLKK
jgi:hypothetical protein